MGFEGRTGAFSVDRHQYEQRHGGVKIHGIFLCFFEVGHKKLFLIHRDHLDLKDFGTLVKNPKLNVFESENSSKAFSPR